MRASTITLLGLAERPISLSALIAANPFDRARGLIGRSAFPGFDAFVLVGCNAIHTCFMDRAVDVLFLDACGVVVQTTERVPPWRLGPVCLAARSVVELPAGFVAAHRRGLAAMPLLEVVPQTATALRVPELA